jgi:hypothetical protein
METGSKAPTPPLDLCSILGEELQALRGVPPLSPDLDNLAALRKHYDNVHHLRPELSAVCLSGGGIRSATFSLGVLQGLAAHGQLTTFDYLSTVSGGGYIGSWLSAWILRRGRNTGEVQQNLNCPTGKLLDPEQSEILQLRAFSNYLSPKVGLFSSDSWTLVATVLRNIFLNWLVLVPLLGALLLVPRLHFAALLRLAETSSMDYLMIAGGLLASIAIFYARSALPRESNRTYSEYRFLLFCLIPLFGAAYLLSCSWAGLLTRGAVAPAWVEVVLNRSRGTAEWIFFVSFGVVIHLAGYWPTFFAAKFTSHLRALADFAAVMLSGAAGGAMFLLLNREFADCFNPLAYACLSIPAILLVYLMATGLYIALTSFISSDDDREWWARAGGWVLLGVVFTAAFNVLIFYGLAWFLAASAAAKGAITSAGGLGGLAAILLGASDRTPHSSREPKNKDGTQKRGIIASLASRMIAPLLVLFIVLLIGLGTNMLIASTGITLNWSDHFHLLETSNLGGLLALLAVFSAVFAFMGFYVNVNKFSLHAMYRSRLIRAYLAASRKEMDRKPNAFTGFDPNDNFPMCDLRDQRPFHVVNVALNLVGGKKLAWQQRKAESFTITPLHCGSASICNNDGPDLYGAYRPSTEFALHGSGKPISLGTAVTISGAAANPNMGYNSSPLLSFLMTFFNARLGAWLGNPARNKWRESGPIYGVYFLALEAMGKTTDDRNFVNLSDGGHFDNLGLYEMVLRRCGRIVVVDGSCDPEYGFEDLANAIRKIRIDMGISITIDLNPIRTKSDHFTVGWIDYNSVDGIPGQTPIPDGKLIYMKAVLTNADLTSNPSELLPSDVRQYAEANPPFPHQSTSDQFFDESQFESYRRLGLHTAERLFAGERPVWDEI